MTMRWNGEGGQTPRLLVADRQPMVAEAMAALLRDRGYLIAAHAHDGAAAAAVLSGGGIEAAIIDIDLAAPATLATITTGRTPIIITAPCPDHSGITAALESNASGLVLKSEPAETLAYCLATVIAGGQWFDRLAMARALDRATAHDSAEALTRRERDVAKLVATGRRNRDIASVLGISEGTVKMHLHNVYAKLGLESRTQLAMDERLRALG